MPRNARWHEVVGRYGWRAPVVALIVLAGRVRIGRICTWVFLHGATQGEKGRHIHIERGVRISPGAHIHLADNVFVGARSTLEVSANPVGRLSVGKGTWISHDCHISCWGTVDIGSDVLVGEFTSLRDTSHAHESLSEPIRSQGDVIGSIVIEDGAWIGRGVAVIAPRSGLTIGRGAIVGANSVVLESVPAYALAAGVPARVVRLREQRVRTNGSRDNG